jgi:hypothetical protein
MIVSIKEVLSTDGLTLTVYITVRPPRDELEALLWDEPDDWGGE